MQGVDLIACVYVFLGLGSLFLTYWIIRLAVRHGIADADERRRARALFERLEEQRNKEL